MTQDSNPPRLKGTHRGVFRGIFEVVFNRKSYSLGLLALSSSVAMAQMDGSSRDALIQKLTSVQLNLAPGEAARLPVTLRLADLHAERGRLQALEESNRGCPGECQGGVEDRRKALGYYQEVLRSSKDASQFRVRLQAGHLQELLGKSAEAQKYFEELLKIPEAPANVRAEAELALAELFYKKRDFQKAKIYFHSIANNLQAQSRGLAAYRAAWCELNTGNQAAAIKGLKSILQSPQLLSRNAASDSPVVDRQFHEEVSRDYATFVARGNFDPSLPTEIYELSPESTRLGNVVYLAAELERLGARTSAIQVWRFALQKQKSPLDRLEAQVHLSHLEMLVGNRSQSVSDLEAALRLWPQVQPCPDPETCKELKNRIKNSLVEWNKNEAQNPSPELLGAYKQYLQVFAESDVSLWAAKVAGHLKDYAQAVELYSEASRIEKRQQPVSAEKLEVALVGAMESAELSKQQGLRELSYTQYLSNSLLRKRELEVLYQRAKIIYDAGDPMRAAEAMREVAFSAAAGAEAVKAQAADLAMDALVLAKNDLLLEKWAQDFSQRFPTRAQEFFSIQRNSVLNQVKALGGGELSSSQAESAWQLLARFPLSGSSHAEQITFYKNRLILAEKLLKYPEAREACDRLLGLPGVSAEDTNFALSRKAWLSEMIFDFDGAFVATSKMSGVRSPEHWLKLALYAELAQRDPLPAYREFLKLSTDAEKKALIAAEIVKSTPAKNQVKELQNFKTILLAQPEIYASLAMEIYVQSMDLGFLNQTLAVPGVSATLSGKVLRRMQLLNDYESIRKLVRTHQIDSANDRKLSFSLKKRVQLLEDAEKLVTRAVNAADWSAQLLSLQLLGDQSLRFYNEVMALPVPEGLSGEQEQMYLQALSQQASPFQVKSKDIEAKLKEFWSQSAALQNLNSDLSKSAGALEKLLWREYQLVAEVAPAEVKPQLMATGPQTGIAKGSLQELEKARRSLRENPQNKGLLEELLQVEKSMGHLKMVSYLQGRLELLESSRGQSQVPQRSVQ